MFKDELMAQIQTVVTDAGTLSSISDAIDTVLPGYNIQSAFKAYSHKYGNVPPEVTEYIACKKTEGCSAGTIELLTRCLRNFFSSVAMPVKDVKACNIRLYLAEYKDTRNVQDTTIEGIRSTLHRFYEWCVNEEYMEHNPCRQIKHIRCEKKQRISLTSLELEYMRMACKDERESAFIEMLYSTGCRLSELIELKRKRIDWQNRTIYVIGKGRKERECYINDKAYITLKKYLDSRTDDGEYVFVSNNKHHSKLCSRAAEVIYQNVLDRTNGKVRQHSPHSMRHTTATLALEAGMPIESISRMLGHANISTTLIYAETNADKIHNEHKRYVV